MSISFLQDARATCHRVADDIHVPAPTALRILPFDDAHYRIRDETVCPAGYD